MHPATRNKSSRSAPTGAATTKAVTKDSKWGHSLWLVRPGVGHLPSIYPSSARNLAIKTGALNYTIQKMLRHRTQQYTAKGSGKTDGSVAFLFIPHKDMDSSKWLSAQKGRVGKGLMSGELSSIPGKIPV